MAEYVKYEEETSASGSKRKSRFKLYKIGKYSFSTTEIFHLSVAYIMISLTLMTFNWAWASSVGIINFVIINFLTIGLGFILHELGHKFAAQYYGYVSEFRADFMMLAIMFILALFSPIIFLAPGAVMILGRLTVRENGIISLAGPLVNLVLAFIFTILAIIFAPSTNSMFGIIVLLGISINAFLGIFNMLPLWVLDGKKILAWNWMVYVSTLAGLIIFFYISFINPNLLF